jgi:HPt (histidine-containing phosphotransfer) domain-containing protein
VDDLLSSRPGGQTGAGGHNPTREITNTWPIDQAALVQLVGAQAAVQMLDYLPDFFEASTPQVQRLLLAASRLDGREMMLVAHTLRGSSANMAMKSLVTLCQTIEKYCETDRLQEAANQVGALQAEYIKIQQAYNLPPFTSSQS